jgi:hypothetical protein
MWNTGVLPTGIASFDPVRRAGGRISDVVDGIHLRRVPFAAGEVLHIDAGRVVGFQTSVGSTDASKIVRSGGATNDSGRIAMTLATSASDSWRSRAEPSS